MAIEVPPFCRTVDVVDTPTAIGVDEKQGAGPTLERMLKVDRFWIVGVNAGPEVSAFDSAAEV